MYVPIKANRAKEQVSLTIDIISYKLNFFTCNVYHLILINRIRCNFWQRQSFQKYLQCCFWRDLFHAWLFLTPLTELITLIWVSLERYFPAAEVEYRWCQCWSKVMTSEMEERPRLVTGGYEGHRNQWVNILINNTDAFLVLLHWTHQYLWAKLNKTWKKTTSTLRIWFSPRKKTLQSLQSFFCALFAISFYYKLYSGETCCTCYCFSISWSLDWNHLVCTIKREPMSHCLFIKHFADTAAILNSIVSNIYYGMLWGQIHI